MLMCMGDIFVVMKLKLDAISPTQTDRQTDILLTEKKVITDLFVIEMKEIYLHVYTRLLIC